MDGIFVVKWRAMTQQEVTNLQSLLGWGSADTLQGTDVAPAENAIVRVTQAQSTSRYYNNPYFEGIYITTLGKGGNSRTNICFEETMVGKKVKLYAKFGSDWTEFEIQIWGFGCYQLNNPGNGPSTPNALVFGDPVGIFDDFQPGESNPNFPPPTHNPFTPWLLINIEQETTECVLSDIIKVTLIDNDTIDLRNAYVYKNNINTGITLQQLIAGYTFTESGDYEVRIVYRYHGDDINPPSTADETISRFFKIDEVPFPYTQRASLVYGYVVPGDPMLFDTIVSDDGTIDYNSINGEFTLRFCGDYLIKWFIIPEMGITRKGVNFALSVNGSVNLIGSGHSKNSPTVGFSIVKVKGPPPTLKLISISDDIVFLSSVTQVKAGILIFKIGDEVPISNLLRL